jgi:hypothetical protein
MLKTPNPAWIQVERTGIEPVTSGLQTRPITRPHLTPTDRIGMPEPKFAFLSNSTQRRSTAVRSHRARADAASAGNAGSRHAAWSGGPPARGACEFRFERSTRLRGRSRRRFAAAALFPH